jgi:hypothetical protein
LTPSFRAYLSAAQVFVPPSPLNYVQVKFDRVSRDTTGWFDTANRAWKPQASGLLLASFQVWDQAGVFNGQGNGITAKLIGSDINGNNKTESGISQDAAAIGMIGSYANTAQSQYTAIVHVDAGDSWRVWNYVQSTGPGASITIDPNPAHTSWFGLFFPD